jgi:type IV secretory pathway VirB10-like protein
MSSRVLAGLLAGGCLVAATGGAYMAVRQNVVQPVPVAASPSTPTPAATSPAVAPVSETEAIVSPPTKPQVEAAPAETPSKSGPARETPKAPAPALHREAPISPAPKSRPAAPVAQASQPVTPEKPAASTPPAPRVDPVQEPIHAPDLPPAPRVPQYQEVVLPSASVIGLEIETALSSERARVEDRVDAKVTRDVMADGHVAIPAGSRVIGSVTLVERGGKVKTPGRLGVRFHTLVLTDGHEVSLHTEPIYREGESPASDSARKIGGAAVGGAILGAIIGGGKGAMIGGATGAAGGSAIVMAGDRNAATLNPGAVVNARLSAPVTLEVEKRDQQ